MKSPINAYEYGKMLPWHASHIAYPSRFCTIKEGRQCNVARGFETNYQLQRRFTFPLFGVVREQAEHVLNRLIGLTKNESTVTVEGWEHAKEQNKLSSHERF